MKIQITALLLALVIAAGCSKKPATSAENAPAQPSPQPPAAQTPAPVASSEPGQTSVQKAPESKVAETKAPTTAAADDNSKPRLDYSPKPIYPSMLQDLCIEGEVRVKMRVTTEGKVEDIQVLESTNPGFANALTNVLPLWRFLPAEKDGIPVARTVNIAIPFIINNRQVDLSENVSHGQAELIGLTRPAHPGKGPAKAIVRITLASETIVSGVEVEKKEGTIDEKAIVDAASQWVFIPSGFSQKSQGQTTVEAEILFTEAGNVLIQYPYPAPKSTY
jgi:TonB family protein